MTRILIVGGGIAGTAAALALDKAGADVAVYEAHPDSGADIGAFLTLASNGMLALAQIDAATVVADAGFPLTTMRVLSATGAELATVALGEHDTPLARYRCLRRAELGAVLRAEAERRGIDVRHGARLRSVAEDATGVTAGFTDGTTARGDVLIGADGLNSTLRPLIDPATAAPRYAGQRVFYGYSTDAAPPSESARITMVRASGAAFGYAVSPDGETFWFARVPGDRLTEADLADASPDRWRDALVPLLRRDSTPAADIVAATGDRLLVTNADDLPDVTRWRTDRMLLVGDAAHAASPATGQGASMALEDAVVLAKALRDADTITAALAVYERLRRPRVDRNIAASAKATTNTMPNRVRRTLRDHRARRRPTGPTPPTQDRELMGQLDWNTPLVT